MTVTKSRAIQKALRKEAGLKTGNPLPSILRNHNVRTTQQLKMQILWDHICFLVEAAMHPSMQNKAKLQAHRAAWTLAEQDEMKRNKK